MNYWWVTQNKTSEEEIRGGYMWAPKVQQNGRTLAAYTFVSEVKKNDVIFSYVHSKIVAIGVALSDGYSASKPHTGDSGEDWQNEGWRVDVDYTLVPKPYKPLEDFELIRPLLPEKYSPLVKSTGGGAQGMYLALISDSLAKMLYSKVGISPDELDFTHLDQEEKNILQEEIEIWNNPEIPETSKERLVLSRVGQGLFRKRVQMYEKACRVTGLDDEKFLIASHIKPWKSADPVERLDGNNGLFLSPHVDKLFNDGFLTFTQNGEVFLSDKLNRDVLSKWSLLEIKEVGSFTDAQEYYLDHHREKVFQA